MLSNQEATKTVSTEGLTNGKFLNIALLHQYSVVFLVSNELGVPEWIGQRKGIGTTPGQLAEKFDLTLRAASAFLVALCCMDVVRVIQDSDRSVDDVVYDLSPSARYFLAHPDKPSYMNPCIHSFATNFISPQKLLEASRQDDQLDLMSAHLEETSEEEMKNAKHFMKHMNAQSYSCAVAFPAVLNLKDIRSKITMLDIGGGSGVYTIAAAKANPNLRGIILELKNIVPICQEYIHNAGLSKRIDVIEGDFLTEPYPAADLVLYANIFHDWPDELNCKLLQHAYNCLNPGGRIVISELLLADDVRSSNLSATSMNIAMIPWTKGRQYRPKEMFERFADVGFINPRIHSLVDDYSLVVAEKP